MDKDPCIPTTEELWASLLVLEGTDKADALSALSISYSGTENSHFSIALAEFAKDLYLADGFDGNEIEFAWIWGVLAESNAELERYNEAIEAGLRYQKGFEQHLYPAYPKIQWEMIRWYLESERFDEAKAHFDEISGRYKFAFDLYKSEFESS